MTQSTNPNSQDTWSRLFLPEQFEYAPAVGKHWWHNPINGSSLRLTNEGVNWVKKFTKFKLHRIDLVDPIYPKQLLQLERLFTQPYFISKKYILVLSDQDAVMLQLHAGDLRTYLDNLQQNQ